MSGSLWSLLHIYLLLTRFYMTALATSNSDDVVYTAANGRLTIATPKSNSVLEEATVTCVKVDRYSFNQFVYCGQNSFVQVKSDGSKNMVETRSGLDKAAFQIAAGYWLLAISDSDCIMKIGFTIRGSHSGYAGCGMKGNDDGVGTLATFDEPRDMVKNVFNEDEVMVLTATKLRLLNKHSASVSSHPITLPRGFTQMVWYHNSLILLSNFFYGKVDFMVSGEISEVYFSQTNIINWMPRASLSPDVFSMRDIHYITDAALTTVYDIFLLGYNFGGIRVLDMINKRTEILHHNNSCIGDNSPFLSFYGYRPKIAIAHSNRLCVANVSWLPFTATTEITTSMHPTATTERSTTLPTTNPALTNPKSTKSTSTTSTTTNPPLTNPKPNNSTSTTSTTTNPSQTNSKSYSLMPSITPNLSTPTAGSPSSTAKSLLLTKSWTLNAVSLAAVFLLLPSVQ